MLLRQMAVAFLFNDNQEVLFLQKKAQAAFLPGYLVPVGGHLHPGELKDPLKACLREIAEETGLMPEQIHGLSLRYIVHQVRADREISIQYIFMGKAAEGYELLESEEGRLEWVDCGLLHQHHVTASTRGVLDHYLATGIHNDSVYTGTMHLLMGEPGVQWAVLQDLEGAVKL